MTELARAEGMELLFDPYERQMENWRGVAHRSSMLQDLESGRRTEIDALNGFALQLARKHGISLPVNDMLWSLTKASEG